MGSTLKVTSFAILATLAMLSLAQAEERTLGEILAEPAKWSGNWSWRHMGGTVAFSFQFSEGVLTGQFLGATGHHEMDSRPGPLTDLEIDGNEVEFTGPSGAEYSLDWNAASGNLTGTEYFHTSHRLEVAPTD